MLPKEERAVGFDSATRSIESEGTSLSGDRSLQERLNFYRNKIGMDTEKEDGSKKKFPGPKTRAYLKLAKLVYATTTAISRIGVVRAEGPFVFDADGFRFLDFHCDAGVNNLGHGNDAIHIALIDQIKTNAEHCETHNAPHPNALDLALLLFEESPVRKPAKVFFSNSGAEANEAAHKLCLAYRYYRGETKRRKTVYFLNGFAGRTAGVLAGTTSNPEAQRNPFWTHCDKENSIYLPYPREGENISEIIRKFELLPLKEVDRMLIEVPCQGEGGIIPIDENALYYLSEVCQAEGIFVISDCVQTGMGRTGTLFGADCFSWFKPDILTMGKALGGSLPTGATIFRADLDWRPGEHSNTFGGNPLVMAAGLAAFEETDKILKSGAINNLAHRIENWLRTFYEFNIVTDVRGRGIMWAVEFSTAEIRDRAVELGEEYTAVKGCGLRLMRTGRKAIRIMPPITIDRAILGYGMNLLRDVIGDIDAEEKTKRSFAQ